MRNAYIKQIREKLSVRALFAAALFTMSSYYSTAQVTVTATAGTTSNSYTTLKAAFDNINNGTHQGDIVIKVHTNTTETATARLDSSGVATGALYTSVLIRPADTATVVKQIATATTGISLVTLMGADNVTFDGRPLGNGTLRLLEFNNTISDNLNFTFRFDAGATGNTLTYIRSVSNNYAATAGVNISFGNTVAGPANSNNTIRNSITVGGRSSIAFDAALATGTMQGILLQNNEFTDFGFASLNLISNIGQITIDSNQFYFSPAFTSGYQTRAIAFSASSTATVNITKNRIYSLRSAHTAMFGIVITPSTGSVYNIINNSIAIMDANNAVNGGAIGGVCGIVYAGTANAEINIYHNTVRIGGTCVGGANTGSFVRSVGVGKFNSGTTNIFRMKNNLCINTRTGGTLISGFSAHPAAWIQQTTGTNDINYNDYIGSTFVAGWAGTLYGGIAGYQAAATPNEANSVSKAVTFTNTTQPYLSGTSIGDIDLSANALPAVTSDIDNITRGTTLTYKGAAEAALFAGNDLGSRIIYTYGKIPVGTLDSIRIRVKNFGFNAAVNTTITANIKGVNNGTLTITVPSISAGVDTTLTFPDFTPLNVGLDTITVFVPLDQNGSNDTVVWIRENTLNALSYTQTTLPRFGNVGTTGEGEIVAKFYTPVPNSVNQVNVNFTNPFFNGPFPFQVVVYEDSVTATGPKRVPLWISATQNTVNGVFNLPLPSIQVSGNFYIGVRQTTANNIGFAYQQENPIRDKTFFFRQGANYQNLGWDDFAVNPANAFRFMIEPRLKINDDLGVIDLNTPGAGCANLGIQPAKFRIQNLGLFTQDFSVNNLSLYGTIRKPSGTLYSFGPVVVNSGMLVSDDHIDVDLTSSFDFDSVGTYTFKAWTVFGPDNNKVNDTLPELQRTIQRINNMPYAQNFNAATTLPEGWQAGRFVVATGAGTGGTNAMRVLINNSSTFAANASLQSPRVSNITSNAVLRFDYRVFNNIGGAATTLLNTDSIKVLVSTDCGNTFTQVHLINGINHVSSAVMQPYEIPLGSFVGSEVMVKFMLDWYGTTNESVIDFDNIRVVDAANDMGVASVSSPCRSVIIGSAPFAPEVTVTNFGTSSQAGVTVNVSITGPTNYTGSFSIPNLNSNTSTVVNMSTSFNPSTAGTYTLKAWTSLTNDGDPTNDTIVTTFNVVDLALGNRAVNALTFGGAQSRVNVANSPTLTVSSGLTIEAWINRSAGVTRKTIVAKDSAVGYVQYALELNDTNGLAFTVWTTSGFYVFTSTAAVPAGFTHVAATFDGSTATLYINGAISGRSTVTAGTILPQAYEMHIGNNNGLTSSFGGAIDELRIWNLSRTENEIRSNMHTRLANAPSIDLVAYFRMDEASGNLFITDASGNCNAGIFGTAAPTRTAALYPLGASASATQTVAFDGIQFFTGTNVAMYFTGVSGTDTMYVHRFDTTVLGTTPITSPGGVTTVYPGYWLIYKYGNGTFSGTGSNIEFTLMNGSLRSSVINSELKLFNRALGSTGNWTLTNAAASGTSFANQTVQYDLAPSAFGNTLSIGANNNPLPVQLIRFTASADKNDAVLRWSTASETNNKGFTVERSLDGKTFTELDFVRGAGNSNRVNDYSYADKNIFATATIAYYRLKQVDINEAYAYTDVVIVKAGEIYKPQVTVYPNPVLTTLNVEVGALSSSTATITITDITGKLVRSVEMPLTEGFNKLAIDDINVLNNGVYLINITANGQVLYTDKLVKAE